MRYVTKAYWAARRELGWLADIPTRIRMFIQRGRDGYSARDGYSLHTYLNSWLPKAIRELKGTGYPGNLSQKRWDKILETIAAGFDAKSRQFEEFLAGGDYKKSEREWRKAMQLLAEYYNHLWY